MRQERSSVSNLIFDLFRGSLGTSESEDEHTDLLRLTAIFPGRDKGRDGGDDSGETGKKVGVHAALLC